MEQALLIYNPTILLIAGLFATLGMSLFVFALDRSFVLNVSAIEAIGGTLVSSQDTSSRSSARQLGWGLHILSGLIFGFVYGFIINQSAAQFGLQILFIGAGLGFIHGIVVSILLVISVGEHHPLYRFRSAGLGVSAIYFLAHIIYGLLLATVLVLASGVPILPPS